MERRARLSRLAALGMLVLAAACTKPLPPLSGVGDPITGVNPPMEGTPGATTTTVTYGPWEVPAATGPGHDQSGMKDDIRLSIAKPCEDCWLTSAKPELTYADGTVANTDTGLWLHHFALFSSGGIDATCATTQVQLLGE